MSGRSDAPVVVAAMRTPIGTSGKSLAGIDAAHLAAPVLARVSTGLPAPAELLLGNCMGPGGNLARVASLASGLSESVPSVTVDRQCGSGLAAIDLGVALCRGRDTVVLAGGVESVSTASWRYWPPASGAEPIRYERAPFAPDPADDPEMGLAADFLAEERGVSRERQDEYAARSYQRAWAATTGGAFSDEIVPVSGIDRDDRPRPRMTSERLGRMPAAFRAGGTVTAGNSCGISDGAAVVAIAPASAGLPGLRVLATATAGVDPNRPGIGIVPAVRTALDRAGLGIDDLDAIEFNEAFAGQVLACCDDLSLEPERVCSQGGAIALGHPWGASGAVLVVRLFSRMIRQGNGRFGLAAIAVGGGQGVAMVVEACR